MGGRGFGSLLTFLLMAGEAFSTFSFFGASGWTYSKGVPAFYILSYGCLAFVIGYWMLPAVWRYAKARGLVSFAEYFASKYHSRAIGVLSVDENEIPERVTAVAETMIARSGLRRLLDEPKTLLGRSRY